MKSDILDKIDVLTDMNAKFKESYVIERKQEFIDLITSMNAVDAMNLCAMTLSALAMDADATDMDIITSNSSGASYKVSVRKIELECPLCKGKGEIARFSWDTSSDDYVYEECPDCKGKGKI